MKVFLGGTAGKSAWRSELIPALNIEYFNPQKDDWTPEMQAEEDEARKSSDYCLYFLTPETPGTYSIAEVVDDSNKRPEKTIFYFEESKYGTFEAHQLKAFKKIGRMVEENGAFWAKNMEDLIEKLNTW